MEGSKYFESDAIVDATSSVRVDVPAFAPGERVRVVITRSQETANIIYSTAHIGKSREVRKSLCLVHYDHPTEPVAVDARDALKETTKDA